MRFWDSSAIVPIILRQPYSDAMRKLYSSRDEEAVAWWATPVECHSAIRRLARMNHITAEDEKASLELLSALADSWSEVEPVEEVRAEARRVLTAHQLKAADSFQLAAALFWCAGKPRGKSFVSLDERLRDAAKAEGFAVLPENLQLSR